MIKEVTLPGFRQAMPVDGSNGKREVADRKKKRNAKRKGGKKEERSARSAIIITGDGDTRAEIRS